MPSASTLPRLASDASLRRIALDLLGDPDLADETVQLTHITAAEKAPRDPRAKNAWLRRIATRRALRLREQRANREQLHRAAAEGRDSSAPATVDVVAQAELVALLEGAVDRLEKPFRDVVRLRYFDGLPPRRIAVALGIPIATVRSRLQRALQKMRGDLDQRQSDPQLWRAALTAFALPSKATIRSSTWLAAVAVVLTTVAAGWMLTARFNAPANPADGSLLMAAAGPSTIASTADVDVDRDDVPTPDRQRSAVENPAAAKPRRRRRALPSLYVVGTVLDEFGDPVPHATVLAGVSELNLSDSDARTDESGSFSLTLHSRIYTCFAAVAPSYHTANAVHIVPAGSKTATPAQYVKLRVARGAMTVRGRVSKPDGSVAAGLAVWAGRDPLDVLPRVPRSGSGSSEEPALMTRTDADGRFELSAVPPGVCHLVSDAADGIAATHATVAGDSGDVLTADLRAPHATDLTVLVCEADTGLPVAARVSYSPSGSICVIEAESNSVDGLAVLEQLPADTDCLLCIEADHGRRARRMVRLLPGAGNTLTVELPSTLGRGTRGIVHRPDGEPMPGCLVQLRDAENRASTWRCETAEDGSFTILDGPEVFDLEVFDDVAPGGRTLVFQRGLRRSDAGLSLVADWFVAGVLTGRLQCEGNPEEIDLRLQHESQSMSPRIEVDSNGEFWFDDAAPGTYEIVAITPEGARCDLGRVELRRDIEVATGTLLVPILGAVEFDDRSSPDPESLYLVRNARGVPIAAGRGRLPERIALAPGRYRLERDGLVTHEVEVESGVTLRL